MAKAGWSRDWSVGVRVWVERRGQVVLGDGRADLLEAIGQRRSITAAAKAVGVSYRKAWNVVQEVNEAAGAPLVEAAVGGVQGGGARLTERGRMAVDVYRQLQLSLEASAASALGRLVAANGAATNGCVHVAAAISLQEALGQILSAFALQRPTVRVRAVYGPSNELASHALAGAPCSVFISAEGQEVDRLAAAGKVVARHATRDCSQRPGGDRRRGRFASDEFARADCGKRPRRVGGPGVSARSVHEGVPGVGGRLRRTAVAGDAAGELPRRGGGGGVGRCGGGDCVCERCGGGAQLRVAVPRAAIEGSGRVCGGARGRRSGRRSRESLLDFLSSPTAVRCLRRCGFQPPRRPRLRARAR